jgi:hypothetical protein
VVIKYVITTNGFQAVSGPSCQFGSPRPPAHTSELLWGNMLVPSVAVLVAKRRAPDYCIKEQ